MHMSLWNSYQIKINYSNLIRANRWSQTFKLWRSNVNIGQSNKKNLIQINSIFLRNKLSQFYFMHSIYSKLYRKSHIHITRKKNIDQLKFTSYIGSAIACSTWLDLNSVFASLILGSYFCVSPFKPNGDTKPLGNQREDLDSTSINYWM